MVCAISHTHMTPCYSRTLAGQTVTYRYGQRHSVLPPKVLTKKKND